MSSLLQQINSLDINKQDKLTSGTNITIDENNVISSSGGGDGTLPEDATFTSVNTGTLTTGTSLFTDKMNISNSPAETTDTAINIVSQQIQSGVSVDTLLFRRISGETVINLREIQMWVDGVNVLPSNTLPSTNLDGSPLGDEVEFIQPQPDGSYITKDALQTNYTSNSVDNLISGDFDTHSEADNGSLYVPLTSSFDVGSIQSVVFYNRTFQAAGERSIGLQLQLFNRVEDPSLSTPIATGDVITQFNQVYRFDFPPINTYSSFTTGISTTNITSDALISNATFANLPEPEYGVAIKILNGRIESNQEMSCKNVVVADTTPTQDNELASKLYVDSSITGTDIGFLAYHNTLTDYSAIRLAPYNIVRYNTGNAYDNSTYIFTVPVAGKYYFYATYFTKDGTKGVLDLMLKKTNQTEQIIARGQEGQVIPGTHEKRNISVVIDCDVGDQLYAKIAFNTIRLSVDNYNSTIQTIYGPFGCQLLK